MLQLLQSVQYILGAQAVFLLQGIEEGFEYSVLQLLNSLHVGLVYPFMQLLHSHCQFSLHEPLQNLVKSGASMGIRHFDMSEQSLL